MARLETLFLDAGGVLVFPNWRRVSEALGRHDVTVTPEALALADPHAKRDLDQREPVRASNDQARGWLYFDLVLAHAGVDKSEATAAALTELHTYHAVHNLWELVPEDVPGALGRFRALGLRLVAVSNANGRLRSLMDRLQLAAHFDHLLDSHLEGVEKPDPRLFRIALERSGARAESTLHVGDLYHVDVAGARAAGLGAALFDVADLYPEVDCPRVHSLGELADAVESGQAASWLSPRPPERPA
jgi:HAD superfamily hydrolase (TIGR01509 family)